MDELLGGYAKSAAAYADAVQELTCLSKTRHTRSAYVAALNLVEKAWQECELARRAFRQPKQEAP